MIAAKKQNNYSLEVFNDRHKMIADVDVKSGGDDLGFNPHELLESSLGACTSITVLMYAKRRNIPLEDVQTTVTITKEAEVNMITRHVRLVGNLTQEQRAKLLEIANKCPMHNFLLRSTTIETREI